MKQDLAHILPNENNNFKLMEDYSHTDPSFNFISSSSQVNCSDDLEIVKKAIEIEEEKTLLSLNDLLIKQQRKMHSEAISVFKE
jgi:hypothetical protein